MNDFSMRFLPNEDSPIFLTYITLLGKTEVMASSIPTDLTIDSFVGYYTHNGTVTQHQDFLIVNENNSLAAYKMNFLCGKDESFAGLVNNNLAFINNMQSLSYMPLDPNDNRSVGNSLNFAILFFKQDGVLQSCYANNIFEKE